MTNDIGRHAPTPEFRASLEDAVRRAMREDGAHTPPSVRRPSRRRERARTVLLLAAGLFLGVGTQLASAQVQESRQRSDLERSQMVERELAALRLQLARQEVERAQQAFRAGALSRQSLLRAEAELRAQEVRAAKLEVDLAEIRATAAAPRDELWAPRVGSRDFVKERLQMNALVAQQRLAAAEASAAEVQRAQAIGSATAAALNDAALDVEQAKLEFQVLANRLRVREEFLRDGLAPEEVTRREQRVEASLRLVLGQARLAAAEQRVRVLREQVAAGVLEEIMLKRAELEMLEMRAELEHLRQRAAALRGKDE
jgi:hypothetical protein